MHVYEMPQKWLLWFPLSFVATEEKAAKPCLKGKKEVGVTLAGVTHYLLCWGYTATETARAADSALHCSLLCTQELWRWLPNLGQALSMHPHSKLPPAPARQLTFITCL